jgi:hypothetical protein
LGLAIAVVGIDWILEVFGLVYSLFDFSPDCFVEATRKHLRFLCWQ